MGTPWMQSVAEAVGAVGTGAGFVIAAAVYWSQQRDRADDEKRQARLILAEVTQDEAHIIVRVTNHSEGVVTDLFMTSAEYWNGKTLRSSGPLRTAGAGQTLILHHETRPMGPMDKVTLRQGFVGEWPRLRHTTIFFQDTNGRRWSRRDNEQPQRVRTSGPRRRRWTDDR